MNKKTTGTIMIEVPIPPEVFEDHRQFHYTYKDRHYFSGLRIVTAMTFFTWYGERPSRTYERVYAESPIQRIKKRQGKGGTF